MQTEKIDFVGLVSDVRNNVDGAAEELYRQSVSIAYVYAKGYLDNQQDIEDALQNSYMHIFRGIDSLKNDESFQSWLKTIVRHECVKIIEKNSKRSEAFLKFKKIKEEDLLYDDTDLLIETERKDLNEVIEKILAKLPEEKRMCLILYYYEQHSIPEIAEIMQIPEGTVRSRLYYSRKKLEKAISKLRQKDDTLFGVTAIPLLVSFLSFQAKNTVLPVAVESSVLASVTATGVTASAYAGTSAGAASTGAASAGGAAAGSVATGGAVAGGTVAATKIAAVAVAVTVAAGGGAAVVNHVQNSSEQTTVSVVSSAITEEYATVRAVMTSLTNKSTTQMSTAKETKSEPSSVASVTVRITETVKAVEVTAIRTAAEQTSVAKTKRPKISREYTLEPPDTTVAPSTTEEITTEATTEEDTTEEITEETTEETTVQSTTLRKTTTQIPATEESELYDVSSGVIGGYTGKEKTLTVPSTIGSESINAIGVSAFEGNTDLESVAIATGIKKIGQTAFADCTSLSQLNLPSTLENIGIGAFSGCSSLTSVTIPSGTKQIGDDAFSECSSLTSITIPSSVTAIGDNAFGGCDSLIIRCTEGSAAHEYAINNSIDYVLST